MSALAQISWSPKGYVPGDGVEEVLARAQFFLDNGMYCMFVRMHTSIYMYLCMYVCIITLTGTYYCILTSCIIYNYSNVFIVYVRIYIYVKCYWEYVSTSTIVLI